MTRNKYQREIKPGVWVDVYDVLQAFNVTCPAMAHGIKKCLAPGQRGAKDSVQDKNEAIASITRSIEMEEPLELLANNKPSCFGRQLDSEACFGNCPVKEDCYNG